MTIVLPSKIGPKVRKGPVEACDEAVYQAWLTLPYQGRTYPADAPPQTPSDAVAATPLMRAVAPFMRKLKFSTKILVLIAVMMAMSASVAGYLLRDTLAVSNTFEALLNGPVNNEVVAGQMQVSFKKQVQEWKDLLLRGQDPAMFEKYSNAFKADENTVRELGGKLKSSTKDSSAIRMLNRFTAMHDELGTKYDEQIKLFGGDHNAQRADQVLAGLDRVPTGLIDSIVTRFDAETDSLAAAQGATVISHAKVTMTFLVLVLLVVLVFAVLVVRSIVLPLRGLVTAANHIADGDVHQDVTYTANDEIGTLADAFRKVVESQRIISGAARRLAAGDVEQKVVARGDQDELGRSMETLRTTLQALAVASDSLTVAGRAGRLSERGRAEQFEGTFRTLVGGMNAMLDAVTAPIVEASAVLQRVADRDLTARMTGSYAGDFATIKTAVNTAMENIEETLGDVVLASEQVASAAYQISHGSQALAQGSSEQASSLEEVSSSLQEMSSMAKQSAANAKEARGLAEGANAGTAAGVASMQRLTDAMGRIKESSDATARIVKTIDEIAFQTNLLALNAAVEAARAGDAGRGFAVVAEEVRNLAMRSAEAAKNTATLIEGAVANAEGGVHITNEVVGNLETISGSVAKVAEVMGEIFAASEQQTEGISQVNIAVDQMNGVTQQVAANSEESASAAEELSAQAASMRETVMQFRISRAASPAAAVRPAAPAAPTGRPRAAAVPRKVPSRSRVAVPAAFGADDEDMAMGF